AALRTPSFGGARARPGHALADDSRARQPSAGVHARRIEAAAIRLADFLSRVLGQHERRMARRELARCPALAWLDELQRVDPRLAIHAGARGGPDSRRDGGAR